VTEAPPVRYVSVDEDSARWDGFELRPGDIVISTRSKTGTTWLQMICALLVFQTAELPAPLSDLSPWLDWLVCPKDEVLARLAGQRHRRFIKTHTPLDGLPSDPAVTYLVAGRHPLDTAVSLYHHSANIDRARLHQLTGAPPSPEPATRPSLHDWLLGWIAWDGDPHQQLDSLPGFMMHAGGAWARRGNANVVLVHYDDLRDDLASEMRRLAGRLGIDVPSGRWTDLVSAAEFDAMRARAERLVPDPVGVLKEPAGFFRRGSSGAGPEALSADELAGYRARVRGLGDPALVRWLHRDR
jgi:aryl sulfotransferase